MTSFDYFVLVACEQKLAELTLDLATSFSYRLSAAERVRIRKDSLAWGLPDKENYPVWERKR